MKTPEEILDLYLENYPWIYSGKENAIKAMKLYAELYYDSEVKKLNIPAVMPSFVLDELRARAKVYQNNYYAVGLDEVERNGWYASWKAMDEAIYIIEHPSKTNEA